METFKYYQYVVVKPFHFPDYTIKINSNKEITESAVKDYLKINHRFSILLDDISFVEPPKTFII